MLITAGAAPITAPTCLLCVAASAVSGLCLRCAAAKRARRLDRHDHDGEWAVIGGAAGAHSQCQVVDKAGQPVSVRFADVARWR